MGQGNTGRKEAPSRAGGASLLNGKPKKRVFAWIMAAMLPAAACCILLVFAGSRDHGRPGLLSRGIDADLVSVSFSAGRTGGKPSINFYLKADEACLKRGSGEISKALAVCFDAFMTGLRLPQDKFWANLSYLEPSRVLDSGIADTITGRVLLYGDLRLKQDIAQLINPAVSPEGALFWESVKKKAAEMGVPDNVVVLNKVWIEPAEACVYMRKGVPCILRCSLRVCQESPVRAEGTQGGIQEYADRLFTTVILPKLNKKVNQDRAYASLRCVYKGLVLAKAYKESAPADLSGTGYCAGGQDLRAAGLEYSAAAIYRKYMKELKKTRSCAAQSGDPSSGIVFTNYFMGGVDFRLIKARSVSVSLPSGGFEAEFGIAAEMLGEQGGLLRRFMEELDSRFSLFAVLSDARLPKPALETAGAEGLSGGLTNQRANSSGL